MLHFIINGKAGLKSGAKAKKIITDILTQRGVEFEFHHTKYAKHATEIAKELSEKGATDIIAIGGDGTVHEVLNGLNVDQVNFGIIPFGSGNDFVDSVKIPLKIEKSLELILSGDAKPTDFLVCDTVRGLNIIGTGIDVEILERCNKYKIFIGKLKYFFSLIMSLIKFKFYNFTLKDENGEQSRSAMIICCCNGKKFGGGIPMCPVAEADDGKMDFIIVDKMKKSKMIGYLIKLMKGKILEQEFCHHVTQDQAHAVFDRSIGIEIDGEIYYDINFDVHIEKGRLKLYRP